MNRTLMIDGLQPHGDGITNGFRFLLIESFDLPVGAELDACDESDPVQVAIFELEAWADWRPLEAGYSDHVPHLGQLGCAAYDIALARIGVGHESHVWLEAAALLRDGWRP